MKMGALTLAAATNGVSIAIALGVCVACTAIAAKVERTTRCVIRLGIFGLFVGALARVLGGWIEFGDWPDLVFAAGVLIYILGNLRSPVAVSSSAWANRLGWGVALVTVALVGATLSAAA